MKEFNLEEYLKNPSRKVVTKNGDSVRIICTDRLGEFPIIGLVKTDKVEKVTSYMNSGRVYREVPSECDLFFAPERKEGWVSIYKNDIGHIYTGSVFGSKEEAEEYLSKKDYLATVKIEWEE